MNVRSAEPSDLEAILAMCARLWSDFEIDVEREDVRAKLLGRPRSTLPVQLFVAEHAGEPIGFVEVGLRSHADGCDSTQACGFIEAWYVAPEHQRHGAGRMLIERAEAWARDRGCRELASDTWIDHEVSQRAHAALGFEVVDRCVHYRKSLDP